MNITIKYEIDIRNRQYVNHRFCSARRRNVPDEPGGRPGSNASGAGTPRPNIDGNKGYGAVPK